MQLQADLKILKGKEIPKEHALTVVDSKAPVIDEVIHPTPVLTEETKALTDAIKKISILIHSQEQIIKLLIQNHTDASSILNEFEKIRTSKLLNSEVFELAHLMTPVHK